MPVSHRIFTFEDVATHTFLAQKAHVCRRVCERAWRVSCDGRMMQFGLLMFFAASTASGDVAFAVGASTALALSYAAYHVVVVNGQCLPRRQASPAKTLPPSVRPSSAPTSPLLTHTLSYSCPFFPPPSPPPFLSRRHVQRRRWDRRA